jgi:hypothetical protein
MFGGIVNAIKGFFDLVTTLVEFVFGFLQDMVNFAQQLVQVPFTVAAAFDTLLPAQIMSYISVLIGAVVVLRVLGRD